MVLDAGLNLTYMSLFIPIIGQQVLSPRTMRRLKRSITFCLPHSTIWSRQGSLASSQRCPCTSKDMSLLGPAVPKISIYIFLSFVLVHRIFCVWAQVTYHTFHRSAMSATDLDDSPILLSCGSLIIDDIRYEDGSEKTNVLGGAGVFAIYGTYRYCWLAGTELSLNCGCLSNRRTHMGTSAVLTSDRLHCSTRIWFSSWYPAWAWQTQRDAT